MYDVTATHEMPHLHNMPTADDMFYMNIMPPMYDMTPTYDSAPIREVITIYQSPVFVMPPSNDMPATSAGTGTSMEDQTNTARSEQRERWLIRFAEMATLCLYGVSTAAILIMLLFNRFYWSSSSKLIGKLVDDWILLHLIAVPALLLNTLYKPRTPRGRIAWRRTLTAVTVIAGMIGVATLELKLA